MQEPADFRPPPQALPPREAADVSVRATEDDIEALRRELAKWQDRVPKLAGALRERTQELEALKARQNGNAGPRTPGIEARDALIRELEAKLKALTSKHQDAQGQLHVRDVEIAELRQDAAEWREKWQQVTAALDAQTDAAAARDQEIGRLRTEAAELRQINDAQQRKSLGLEQDLAAERENGASLEARNAQLFETTELANRQIASLGESLEQLRAQLKDRDRAFAESSAAAERLQAGLGELTTKLASRDQDIEFLHGHVETKQQEINALAARLGELDELRKSKAAAEEALGAVQRELEARTARIESLEAELARLGEVERALAELRERLASREAELDAARATHGATESVLAEMRGTSTDQAAEIARLEACIEEASAKNERREAERRELSAQLDEQRSRNQHLEAQLAERSNLVVGLEQESHAIKDRSSTLAEENARLAAALEKAERHASEHADHIAQLDDRLERQKQLMTNLEGEYAQVQEDFADAVKRHGRLVEEKTAAIQALEARLAEVPDTSGGAERVALETERAALQAECAALGAECERVREALNAAEAERTRQVARAEELERDNDRLRTEQEAARKQLAETAEQLETQLRKQTKAAADAEAATAAARAELEAVRAERREDPDDAAAEVAVLLDEVQKLEGMVRDRTEQLNKLRWQQTMLDKQLEDSADGGKMLVVLNQQLQSAREDNRRLLEKVRALEAGAHAHGASERATSADATSADETSADETSADDLAQIRGIGPKLVGQLAELGITRFAQIAALTEAALDDESHPLHGLRGRVLKDGWIQQAGELDR